VLATPQLWHPFSTGMERVLLLRDLRENGALPPEWEMQNPQVRACVLACLPWGGGGSPSVTICSTLQTDEAAWLSTKQFSCDEPHAAIVESQIGLL
jgi:hypothetical protein